MWPDKQIDLNFQDSLVGAIMKRINMVEDAFLTEEDVVTIMMEMDMLPTLVGSDGAILTDNSGVILLG